MQQKQTTDRQNKEAISDEKVKAAMMVAAVRKAKRSVVFGIEMPAEAERRDDCWMPST